jgi:ribulose-5-phosphate 4-epimerase/fuculose-1-phosphate aldolase
MFISMSLSYHDYQGVVFDPAEAISLQADLGKNQHMILRNHGLLTVGATVSKAFFSLYNLQKCCEMQVAAQAGDGELITVSAAAIQRSGQLIQEILKKAPKRDLLWEAKLRWLRKVAPDFGE